MATPNFKSRVALFLILFSFLFLAQTYTASGAAPGDSGSAAVAKKLRSLQIPFIENKGQLKDGSVGYYARTFGGTVFITEDGEIVYSLPKYGDAVGAHPAKAGPLQSDSNGKGVPCRGGACPAQAIPDSYAKGWVIKETFVGASIAAVNGEDTATSKVSYFKGSDPAKWKSGISTYNLVSLGEVYPGIEVKLKARGDNVEKLFHVQPGSDPATIKIKIDVGAHGRAPSLPAASSGLSVNDKGELEIATDLGLINFTKPVGYQTVGAPLAAPLLGAPGGRPESGANIRKYVEVSYAVEGDSYTFRVGEYDRGKELVIDPLLASTFIGGIGEPYGGYSIILDANGNVYVAGEVGVNFPSTPGAYDTTGNGDGNDAFVAKFTGDLTTLIAATIIGSSYFDAANSIAIDNSGNVYVAGNTLLSDFPTTDGAYDTTYNGGLVDAFVAKLDGDLTTLLASTLIGGAYSDVGHSIVIGNTGNVYLMGGTHSPDFPTSDGAYDTIYNGENDVFVAKLDGDLTTLLASTYLGSTTMEHALSIAADGSGNIYVAGSAGPDFPTTAGAYDTTHSYEHGDAFVAKLSGDLKNLLASTYLGGRGAEHVRSIAIDSSGNVYGTGATSSDDFPGGPCPSTGSTGAFVAKFNGGLTSLLALSIIGEGHGMSIALDRAGNVYVAGDTISPDFPTTAGVYDTTINGGRDAFVAKFSGDFTRLFASTFVGGNMWDINPVYPPTPDPSIVLDGMGTVYMTGSTYSPDFPTTDGAYNTTFVGPAQAFVAKLDMAISNTPPVVDAGSNVMIAEAQQSMTTIYGSASDPDGDSLTYRWLERRTELQALQPVGPNGEANLNLGTLPYFSIGEHTLTLEVRDQTTVARDCMLLTISNSPPVAAPAGGGTYEVATDITLMGGVSDFDGDELSYRWFEGMTQFVSGTIWTTPGGGPVPLPWYVIAGGLPVGVHTVTLEVSDGVNASVSADIAFTVVDSMKPTLAPVPSTTILWPPNHVLVPVTIAAIATDNSGVVILSIEVTSSEPPDMSGDGSTIPDIYVDNIDDQGVIYLRLRSERAGEGDGRIYTVTITATDPSGNSSVAVVQIKAPHDRRAR